MVYALLFACCGFLVKVSNQMFIHLGKRSRLTLFCLMATGLAGNWSTAAAGTKSPTTTTLTVTSGGGAATSVASGSVVTLTASVLSGTANVTTGQVNFCDASATYCTDIHVLGTAQLTSAGTAVYKFRPGIGSHSYKAVFTGTNTYVGSPSEASSLTVTGTIPSLNTTSTIDQTGGWGAYSLSATVTETGNTAAPTGLISFLDTNHGNAVLGAATLGAATRGVNWTTVNTSAPSVAGVICAVADLNADGIPDLFIKDYFGTYDVLLGNGDGTFTVVGSPFGPSSETGSFVVGDFNNDGIPDVAAINAAEYAPSGTITIFVGNGDGTFTVAGASPAIGMSPSAIATADIDGDGNADLVIVQQDSSGNGQIVTYFGKGDGTFTQAPSTTSVASTASSIIPADLNNDGNIDFVMSGNGITILLGKGDGTFTVAAGPAQAGEATVSVADVNNDGVPDLVFGAAATSYLTVFLGNGDGTFTEAPSSPNVNVKLNTLAIADFNQDGIPDIVYAANYTTTAGVLFGKGDGSFVQIPATLTYSYDFNPDLLAVADFNGDGWPDVLTEDANSRTVIDSLTQPTESATASATVSIAATGAHLVDATYPGDSNYNASTSSTLSLWGTPPATTTSLLLTAGGVAATSVAPGTVVTFTATVNVGASPLATGQVNFCDASAGSCTDIHLLGTAPLTSSGTATFKYVPGPGTYSYKAEFVQNGYGFASSSSVSQLSVGPAPAPVYSNTTAITSSGFAGDYSLTATVVGVGGPASPTGSVSFLDTSFGNASLATAALGTGTAGTGWLISQTPALGGTNLAGEVTSDFNGDGIPDLAILWNPDLYAGGPFSVTILFGKGDGTFTTGSTVQLADIQMSPVLIAGDFNGDGKADLLILNSDYTSAENVIALLGNGDGTFGAPQTSPISTPPQVGGDFVSGSIAIADFNGDGKLDLAVVGENVIGGVTIALGNGDGTFTPTAANLEPNLLYGTIATGDLNGDGIPDLVATQAFESNGTAVFLGKGDGTFTESSIPLPMDSFSGPVVIGDFNGDGSLDLAIANGPLGGVTIFLGKGDGTFSETSGSPISGGALSLVAGDFNHDGKLDLAGIDKYNNQVDLFIGAGDGTFTEVVATPNVSQSTPSTIVAADFNADGVPDLALLTSSISTATILLTEPTETATATVNNIAPIGAGTHNVEASYSGDTHYSASVSGTIALTAALAPVVISPASGTYSSVQTITLTESVPGATIYYQAFGTLNTNGFVPYTAPIQLTEGGTESILAYATETGYQQSDYTMATYTLNLPLAPAPVFSPADGSYTGAQMVTISDAAAGATIYYTTNGSLPSIYSSQYTGPITVSTSETLVAIAVASGYSTSPPTAAQYIIGSSPASFIYTLAGNGFSGYAGDGGAATLANLNQANSSVVDGAGSLYIADSFNNVIRKVAAGTEVITTFAGTGIPGYSGDNGAATSAQLSYPTGLSLDGAGDLYFADEGNNAVRMIAAETGMISTVAGNGTAGFAGDGGLAASSQLFDPRGTAVDKFGNLYISDTGNNRIRQVAATTGTITTVAGNGEYGYGGDGGPATSAEFQNLWGIAVDQTGNLYIADTYNDVVREVTVSTGVISTVAGVHPANYYPPANGYSGDGGPATSAQLNLPVAVTLDASGNLYIADTYNQVIREVTSSNGIINTIAGNGPGSPCYGLGGDGGPAVDAALCNPAGISIGGGNLYIADSGSGRIRIATAAALPPTAATAAPTINIPAGTYASPQSVTISDPTPGASIYLTTNGAAPGPFSSGYNGPINASGNVTVQAIAIAPGYLASPLVSAAYNVTSPPTTVINTVAGTGAIGMAGAGGPATSAQVGQLSALTIDSAGDLFFTDTTNNVVWEIAAATENISVVAGNGTSGFSGDGGPATSAQLNYPEGIAVDGTGNLYMSDTFNNVVREVSASTGLIKTFAGMPGQYGFPGHIGDGGAAAAAYLSSPQGLAFDKAGNLYIADFGNNEVRMISAASGIITAAAGNGNYGFSGEGGLATSAILGYPTTLAFDGSGNLYIAAPIEGRVCKVAANTGILTTVAGNGNPYGSSGDGGLATSAEVDPLGLALDRNGNLYMSNWPGVLREVSASTGIITKVVGNGYPGYSGDGGSATAAQIQSPQGIAFDGFGNLYIADSGNYRVREVSTPAPTATPIISPASGTYTRVQMATITDSSTGAVIYYTTDGTMPTNTSSVYSGPIAISATTTLQAIAIAPGLGASAVASATYTIQVPVAPTVTVTPSATSITTAQSLSVAITVAGPNGSPTPTGSVTLNGGGYSSVSTTLANGSATLTIAPGALTVGTDTLTAAYTPDMAGAVYYTTATQSATVNVAEAIGTAVATVTLTPSATTVTNEQAVSVTVSVAGATGQPTPTGTVTLSGGGSYSAQQSLAGGAATFSIAAGAIGQGANTLTANYSGDVTYAAASGTTTVTVAPVLVAAPNPPPVAPGGSTSATATFSAGSTYSGTMNLTCTLTGSPTGAQSLPTCSLNPASITISSGGTASTVVTVNTTAASSGSALLSPGRQLWKAFSGGGVLALALLFGVPSWRRRKALMMAALFGAVVAGILGCGGGGGSSTSPPPTTPATTGGSYTFTVTGTDASNAKMTTSTNVTVTVE